MEPVAWPVKILSKAQGSSDLSPNPQVVQINDSVFFVNQTSEAHIPAPQGGDWFIERDANGNPILDPNGKTIPKNLAPGEPSEQVQFTSAGEVEYYCKLHPSNEQEKGKVIVPVQLIQIRRSDAGNIQYDYSVVNLGTDGAYVWWLNVDVQQQPHQPSFPGIDARIAPTEMSAPILFSTLGAFGYICKVHPNDPNDRGMVIVAEAQVQISSDNNQVQYSPATIHGGSYVWWSNGDSNPHQPSFEGFKGPIAPNSTSVAIQFNTPGNFPYTCLLHPNDPNDRGSITVT